MLAETRRDG